MEKTIHVNAYTKKDGTQVKEHYRNIGFHTSLLPEPKEGPFDYDRKDEKEKSPYDMYVGANDILTGGVEVFDFPEGMGEGPIGIVLTVAMATVKAAFSFAIEAAKAAAAGNAAKLKQLKPQIYKQIENLKVTQQHFKESMNQTLDKLSTSKGQVYNDLLKIYIHQKAVYENLKDSLSHVEYAAECENYPEIVNCLQKYQSDFDDVMKVTRFERPLYKYEGQNKIFTKKLTPESKNLPIYLKNHYINQKTLNAGISILGEILREPDAKALWKASSHDFSKSKAYIQKNGNLVYSVKDLPSQELQQIVTNKLIEQLGTSDALGVIFQPDSKLSDAIAKTPEMQEFFRKNFETLQGRELIKKSSINFVSSPNVHNALGHADILYTYIDANGNLNSIVFDTYDFNPNENTIIGMARTVQEAELLRNYYTLTILKIPETIWQEWLK